jgi:hypothetical protein
MTICGAASFRFTWITFLQEQYENIKNNTIDLMQDFIKSKFKIVGYGWNNLE